VNTRVTTNTLYSIMSREFIVNPIVQSNSNIDMNIDILRGRLASSSANNSRVLSAHSNMSFVLYYKRIEIQSNK